eukprot:4295830-Amphidinium_carterae.1
MDLVVLWRELPIISNKWFESLRKSGKPPNWDNDNTLKFFSAHAKTIYFGFKPGAHIRQMICPLARAVAFGLGSGLHAQQHIR